MVGWGTNILDQLPGSGVQWDGALIGPNLSGVVRESGGKWGRPLLLVPATLLLQYPTIPYSIGMRW